MDKSVEHSEECSVTTRSELNAPPTNGWHNAVVNDVQIGDLIKLFAQNEENSVEELGELAEIVPPTHVSDNHLIWVIGVIDRLTTETVAVQPSVH